MAGSRLAKLGSIFTRTTGLLRSGALKPEDKPIWYDVYQAFPPKLEPRYDRAVPIKEITNIFYEEDVIRAKFYKTFGSPGIVDLANERTKTIAQKFINNFYELAEVHREADNDFLFQAATDALVAKGILASRHSNVITKKEDSEDLKSPNKDNLVIND